MGRSKDKQKSLLPISSRVTRSKFKPTNRIFELIRQKDWKGALMRLHSNPLDIEWCSDEEENVLINILQEIDTFDITSLSSYKHKNRYAAKLFEQILQVEPHLIAKRTKESDSIFGYVYEMSIIQQSYLSLLDQANSMFGINAIVQQCLSSKSLPHELIMRVLSFSSEHILQVCVLSSKYLPTIMHRLMSRVAYFKSNCLYESHLAPVITGIMERDSFICQHRNYIGMTPLHILCNSLYVGYRREIPTDAIEQIIQHYPRKCFLMLCDKGKTPLHFASATAPLPILRILIKTCPEALRCKDVQYQTPKETVFHYYAIRHPNMRAGRDYPERLQILSSDES